MNSAFLNSIYQSGLAAGLSDVQARLMAAQAAHESGNGAHAPGNNFFGIKAGGNWNGATQSLMTGEEVGGRNVRMRQNFRKYDSPGQAIQDRISFMQQKFPDAFNATDINSAVAGLQHGRFGSYATDSNYAQKLQPYLSAIGAAPDGQKGQEAYPPSPLAQPDGPKGQEAYAPSPLASPSPFGAPQGQPAPGGDMASALNMTPDEANAINAKLSDNQPKSLLQSLGEALKDYQAPAAPRPPAFPGGPSEGQSTALLKMMQNPQSLAQMFMQKRIG